MRVVNRSPITLAVVQAVDNNIDQHVGDAEAPQEAGWQGEVGDSDFHPYVVITPEPSTSIDGPIGDPQSDVTFMYSLSVFGVSRRQCEGMADTARQAVKNLVREKIGDQIVQMVWIQQYGRVNRSQHEPPYYAQVDTVAVQTTPSTGG